MTEILNKNVLITGAASGIGRLIATRTASAGGNVILWDINKEALLEVQHELQKVTSQVALYQCDLVDYDQITATAKKVLAEQGRVDILINNAGIVTGKTLMESSKEDIQRVFAINTMAVFWTTKAFLPAMIERNSGHIVTISSAAAICGTSQLIDYTATKYALAGFDESLRFELEHRGANIKTLCVYPYYINTGMFAGVKTRFSWILPILDPFEVSFRIVKAIEKNQRRVVIPKFLYVAILIKILPIPLFDFIVRLFGINESMNDFKGRRPKDSGTKL